MGKPERSALDHELRMVDVQIERTRERLRASMRNLGQSLLQSAGRLMADPVERVAGDGRYYGLNALGEVQAAGASIDNLCGRFDALESHRAALLRIRDDDA